jgi:protein-S-isoprenylcysteine O-methyltransferase Ste14
MGRARAALGSLVFLVIAPGSVAALIPWLLTRWHAHDVWTPLRVLGGVMIVVSAAGVLRAFARFVVEGLGTPAPVAPPRRLVVTGEFRYVRNPIYIAILAVIVGQALLLGRAVLLADAAVTALVFAAWVRIYEEPTLRRQFGEEYETYRRAVPAWLPRLTPWRDG